jgi:hypothetical protein
MILFKHAFIKWGTFVSCGGSICLLSQFWAMADNVFVSPEDKWALVSKELSAVVSSPHRLGLFLVACIVVDDFIKLLLQLHTERVHLLKTHFLLLFFAEVVVDVKIFVLNVLLLVWHKTVKIGFVKSSLQLVFTGLLLSERGWAMVVIDKGFLLGKALYEICKSQMK